MTHLSSVVSQSNPILATKLPIPFTHPQLIPRLAEGLNRRKALSAPM
jgi:hypothetical protein